MNRRTLLSSLFLLGLAASAEAATQEIRFTVSAGKHDRTNTPVVVPVKVAPGVAEVQAATLTAGKGNLLAGQVTRPGLHSDAAADPLAREIHFILPRLAAGQSLKVKAVLKSGPASSLAGFAWNDTPGKHIDLRWAGRPVLRYMYEALDDSSKERRELTYKPFHHLYDPTGKVLLTKGAGGQFTHHRGLYYGFNKVTYGTGKTADVWHCTGDAHQSHQKFLAQEAGPVLGRHRLEIHWHGQGKEVFAREEREITVYNTPGGILVQFASRLRSAGSPVHLDGDPQHAGFHFRADNEVAAETKGQTYYVRPDGVGAPGQTRNWPGNKDHVNLPWNAMSFVRGGERYTAAYLDRPQNPKEARFSERDYGRFGSYFVYDLDGEKSLDVRYRIWLQPGEMTVPAVAARSADFVEPVGVTVRR